MQTDLGEPGVPKTYTVVPINILYAQHLDIHQCQADSDETAFALAIDYLGPDTPFVLREGDRRVRTHWALPSSWRFGGEPVQVAF